jgi:hypothetical protein
MVDTSGAMARRRGGDPRFAHGGYKAMKQILLVAFVLLAAASCSDTPPGPEGFRVSTLVYPYHDGLWFRSGDSVDIAVYVTNLTDADQVIDAKPCPPKFIVTSLDGEMVAPNGILCTSELQLQTVRPSEVVIFHFKWSGEATYPAAAGQPKIWLRPGTYRVRGFIQVEGVGRVMGSSVTVAIQPALTAPER